MSTLSIENFSERTLELEDDYEGKVIATLITSPKNKSGQTPILFIHGLNDYYFHAHIAEQFHKHGYNFYALDLRKFGRSLLPHQHPNYCRSITEYFEEIDRSLQIIHEEQNSEIIILGHSTGGMTASTYLNIGKNRHLVKKLILNSPFFEFNIPFWLRIFLLPMAGIVSYFFPFASRRKPLSHLYNASVSDQKNGEWAYNTKWKPLDGFPAYLKWIYAINKAQKKLRLSSDIRIPILILHSNTSSQPRKWTNIIKKTDMVLNVNHIKKYGSKLGPDVTFSEIPNAMHDVFLSQKKVRDIAFQKMFEWL